MSLVEKLKSNALTIAFGTLGICSATLTGMYAFQFGNPLAALGASAATAGIIYDTARLYKGRPAGTATALLGGAGYGLVALEHQLGLELPRALVPIEAMTAISLGVVGTLERYVDSFTRGTEEEVASG